jgi:branched-chain amino acid transport system ATP-binding protein
VLTASDLEVAYGRLIALRGVSIDVAEGEAVAILGANGAGKSTLVNCIAGVVPAHSGTIRFEDERIDGMHPEQIVRRGVSLVPEGRRIWSSLTVEENIRLGASRHTASDGEAIVQRALDRFPVLREMARRTAGVLSGGQQQQLAIARALVNRPKLLLLDEPTLGLAPAAVDSLFELLTELRSEGLTLLLVEQHTARAVSFCNRSYVLRNGQVALTGSGEELLDHDDLVGAYLS